MSSLAFKCVAFAFIPVLGLLCSACRPPTAPLPLPEPDSASHTAQDLPPAESAPPAQAPEPPQEPEVQPVPDAGRAPDPVEAATFEEIEEGMPYAQVADMLRQQGAPLTAASGATQIYKWTDIQGRTLQARFENGALVRKTVLQSRLTTAPAAQSSTEGRVLTEETYAQIKPGMPLSEIEDLLPLEPVVIASNENEPTVLQWTDPAGYRFVARFQDGRLTRKTALIHRRNQPTPQTEPAAAVSSPLSIAPSPNSALPQPPAENTFRTQTIPEQQTDTRTAASARSRVAVAGAPAGTGEAGGPSGAFRPKADVPDTPFSLRDGVYEVRFVNPTQSVVKASLTEGKRGKSLTIDPGAARSMRVGKGTYALHYVFKDQPYTLYQGGAINIDGQFQTDFEIHLYKEGAGINPYRQGP